MHHHHRTAFTRRRQRRRCVPRRIEIERERLDLEARTQATPLRVEKLAREQLGMRTITPAITVYVTDPAQASASKGGQP